MNARILLQAGPVVNASGEAISIAAGVPLGYYFAEMHYRQVRTFTFLLAIVTTVAALEAFCRPVVVDGVAAVVNGRAILVSDVNRVAVPLFRRVYRGGGDKEEAQAAFARVYREALATLVERQMILTCGQQPEAAALESMVDQRLDETIRGQFGGDRSAFQAALAEEGLTLEDWRKEVGDSLAASVIKRREVGSRVAVSPAAARRRYEQNVTDYSMPEKVLLKIIVVGKGSDAKEAAEKRRRIMTVKRDLDGGADFGDLARSWSEDESAANGGERGWTATSGLKPEVIRAVRSLKAGQYSSIIEGNDGYTIVKIEDRQGEITVPFEEVRDDIERKLLADEQDRVYTEWIKRLKARSYVSILRSEQRDREQ